MPAPDFDVFYHAATALLHGLNPYSVFGFFNPVWALLPFLPLTLLPLATARSVWLILTLLGTLIALWRFGLPPLAIAAVVLLSPLVWVNLTYGNLDWLILLGASLAPRAGAVLLSMKPQMALGSFGFQAAHRSTRLIPFVVVLALVANYALLGLPDFSASATLQGAAADLFPWALPLGLGLLWRAIRRDDRSLAFATALGLSPYFSITSWLCLAPLARSKHALVAILVISWLGFILWRARL